MRLSMSVPRISSRALGATSRPIAASVYASAPYEQPALHALTVPVSASEATILASVSHCSGLRQSCDTLMVTRSRKSFSSSRLPESTWR